MFYCRVWYVLVWKFAIGSLPWLYVASITHNHNVIAVICRGYEAVHTSHFESKYASFIQISLLSDLSLVAILIESNLSEASAPLVYILCDLLQFAMGRHACLVRELQSTYLPPATRTSYFLGS